LLEEYAVVEVRPYAPPLERPALGKGAYDVWLVAYPREHRVAVVRTYRDVSGVALAEARRWAEQAPPLAIAREVDRRAVELLRGRFAGLGSLQVRTKPAL